MRLLLLFRATVLSLQLQHGHLMCVGGNHTAQKRQRYEPRA